MNACLPRELLQKTSSWLKASSGIHLSEDKAYLFECRLNPVALEHGYANAEELLERLANSMLNTQCQQAIIDAMTTNESLFFRDQKPFDALTRIMIPELIKNNHRTLSLWSAACASGQELYSIAMQLSEQSAQLDSLNIELSGSDISTRMVTRAQQGIFSQFEIQRGLPITLVLKYFHQLNQQQWQISSELRRIARFFVHNLLDGAPAPPYHVIFCRYVLIYFDDSARQRALSMLASALIEGGYLVLGSSESIRYQDFGLHPLEDCPGVYVRKTT